MKKDRALGVVIGALVLAFLAFQLAQRGPAGLGYPGCPFRGLTGLNCPGCGMTRATYATLHGEIGLAFRNNALGMILLPLLAVGFGVQGFAWIRGKRAEFWPKIGTRGVWIVLGIVGLFWILRNIPQWPFTLLAPL
jgi:hypothetical protein